MTKLWITDEENLKPLEDKRIHKKNPQSYAQESLFSFSKLDSLSRQISQDY